MSSRNDPRIFWTEKRIKILKKLWDEKPPKSNAQIAEIMGSTRNGVAGIASRLGLTKPKPPPAPKKPRVRKQTEEQKAARLQPKPPASIIRGDSIPPMLESVHDLTGDKCAYPYGAKQFKFCGRPRVRGSFCELHADLCYTVAPPRNRRPMIFRKWQ